MQPVERHMCVICQEGDEPDHKATDFVTSCEHHYHKVCLDKWREKNNICPTCREKLPVDPFLKIAKLVDSCPEMLAYASYSVLLLSARLAFLAGGAATAVAGPGAMAALFWNEHPLAASSICAVGSLLQFTAAFCNNPAMGLRNPVSSLAAIFALNIALTIYFNEQFSKSN